MNKYTAQKINNTQDIINALSTAWSSNFEVHVQTKKHGITSHIVDMFTNAVQIHNKVISYDDIVHIAFIQPATN